jgi:hypothetical protein
MTDFTASETNICNLALQQMGRSTRIASLAETTTEAGPICALQYPISRDAVLRAFPWNFAQRRAALTAFVEAPAFEYANHFKLPSDFLFLTEIFGSYDAPYKLETFSSSSSGAIRVIVTDLGAPLNIRYTARISDAALFDPLFTTTLAAHMAAEMAIPLTETRSKADGLYRIYQQKLIEARKVDSQEGTPDPMQSGSWVDSRFGTDIPRYSDFLP